MVGSRLSEILLRCKAGDEAAWGALIPKLEQLTHRRLSGWTFVEFDSEEIYLQSLFKIVTRPEIIPDHFESETHASNFLFEIIRWMALSSRRTKNDQMRDWHVEMSNLPVRTLQAMEIPHEYVIVREKLTILDRLVGDCCEKDRSAFMEWLVGHNFREIAKKRNIPQRAAWKRVDRVLEKIEKNLALF